MASACVNNPIAVVPTSASASASDHAFVWLSPRVSVSHDPEPEPDLPPGQDPDFIDFEFRLHDPVAMLPADELFSGGKLVPLHLPKPPPASVAPDAPPPPPQPAQLKQSRREELIGSGSNIFAVSPKAPTCTSRWRELLRIKKQQQQQQQQQSVSNQKPEPVSRNQRSSAVKQFLHRRSSLAADPNLNLPLLLESEPEHEAFSRLSLSSSTSSDEISRLSLDSDLKPRQNPNPNPNPILLNRNPSRARISSSSSRQSSAAGVRVGRTPARRSADAASPRCASVDSPRMNASGKVVFHGLGRSSSSPSTFNGGPLRNKYNNVRVINVPVPSKAGLVFGFLGSGSKNVGSSAGPKGKN